MFQLRILVTGLLVASLSLAASAASLEGEELAQVRRVQFANIDFVAGVIELHNFGDTAVPLDGWRFCTADEDQVLRYSASAGLNGRTLEVGESLFIYMNNDAPAGDPLAINRSDTGADFNWAIPIDQDAYGLALYYPDPDTNFVNFNLGALIADYVQWGDANVTSTMADVRAGEAEGQVWNEAGDFIIIPASTTRLVLRQRQVIDDQAVDTPDSYLVIEEPADCSTAGGNADADGLCDDVDPCPAFPNGLTFSDKDANGVPDECQCGDPNGSGSGESDDLFDLFGCLWSDPTAQSFPCSQIIFRGDTNLAQSGRAVFESADLFNMFGGLTDPDRRVTYSCLARPDGQVQIPQ